MMPARAAYIKNMWHIGCFFLCLHFKNQHVFGEYIFTQQCRHCVEGEYCFNDVMQLCPEFSTSAAGSDNVEDCICNDGYKPDAQHNCAPCIAGEFCANDVLSTCEASIGPHMTSALRAVTLEDCVCVPGYYWTGAICEACNPGSYKIGNNRVMSCSLCVAGTYSTIASAVDSTVCQNCPAQSVSVAGSDELTDCQCNLGSTGSNGGPCEYCEPGTFKDILGSEACTDCSVLSSVQGSSRRRLLAVAPVKPHSDSLYYSTVTGSVSSNDCIACPQNSRIVAGGSSGSASTQCECFEGHTFDGLQCVPCAAGTYKDITGPDACIACAVGKFNTLRRSWQETDCLQCPPESYTADVGTTSQANCLCNAGFFGADALSCTACAPGSYSIGLGNVECDLCAIGSYESNNLCVECNANFITSAEGSTSPDDCVCDVGFEIDSSVTPAICLACPVGAAKGIIGNDACVDCAIGFYQDQIQSSFCFSCPFGSNTTLTAASRIHHCVCLDGYETFSNSTSVLCSVCDRGHFSQHNNIEIIDFGVYLSKSCVSCGAGEFVQDNACVICGDNSGAETVLSSAGLCLCQSGYTCTPHRYFITAVNINSDGVWEFEMRREETYENDAGILTQSVSASEIEMPLWVPVIVDWSAIATQMQAFFATYSSEVGGQIVYASVSDMSNTPAVQVIDNTQYITTVVMKQEASVYLVGALTNFAGMPVQIHACPCIACDAGFVKTEVGNQCICGSVQDSACVQCVDDDRTHLSCRRCAQGQFSALDRASTACVDCAVGTYSTQALSTCIPCPMHSYALGSGEISAAACLCNAGYYKSEACEACPANYFKSTRGDFACTMCPAPLVGDLTAQTTDVACVACPSTSFYNASDGSAQCTACDELGCECPAGFTGDGKVECVRCAQGTWKSAVGSMPCTACPAGYIGHDTNREAQDTACVQCDIDTYASAQTCVSCVTGTAAPAASAHVSDCIVQPGYELDTSGIPSSLLQYVLAQNIAPVRPCAPGTFKSIAGTSACVTCEDGKFQSSSAQVSCIACPANTVQIVGADRSLLDSCLCAAGFFRNAIITIQDSGCVGCASGKFTQFPDSNECQGCTSGQYFAVSGTAHDTNHCQNCPSDSHSQNNAVLISSCVCNSGYERISDVCHACNNNETEIDGVCIACPTYSAHALVASSQVTDCVCVAGYRGLNGLPCTPCATDVWCDMGQQYECPESTSTRGMTTRTNIGDCFCEPGFYNFDNVCVACPANSYCDFDEIAPCPQNSISSEYTSTKSACQCVAGYKKELDAIGDFIACIECHAGELCTAAQFRHKILVNSDATSIPQISVVKRAVDVMFAQKEYTIQTVLTTVKKKTIFPATQITISKDVIADVQNTATLDEAAISVVDNTIHSLIEFNISFSNIAPATASQGIRDTIVQQAQMQTFSNVDINNWVNVSTKSDFVPSSPPTATYRRRNLLAVIVPYSIPSPPPAPPIFIASDSVTFLSAYAATVRVNVTAIVQAHEQAATIDFVLKLTLSGIENDINQLFHNSMRRLLASYGSTSESSATVDSMRLETTMETVYSSGSDTIVSTNTLLESQDAMEQQLSTATDTDPIFASTDTSTETVVEIDTSVATQSIDELSEQNTKTVFSVQKSTATTSIAASSTVCVNNANVVNDKCYCVAGMYCLNLLDTDVSGCTANKGVSCDVCPQNYFCTGNNYAQDCSANFATIQTGISDANNCLCNAGYFKSSDVRECLACGVGGAESLKNYFCPFNNDKEQCDSTLNFQTAAPLAASALDCMCKPGYFRMNNLDTCKPCPLNHYCPIAQSNTNTLPNIYSCPLNMITTGIASASLSSCLCRVGFKSEFLVVSTTCLECATNELCSSGTLSGAEVTCAINQQPADDHSACICKPGYYTTSVVQGIHTCMPCAAGEVQTDAGQFECSACGLGFFAQNADQACVECVDAYEEALGQANTMCRCQAPYVRGNTNLCELCSNGEYFQIDTSNSVTHAGTCLPCPQNSLGTVQAHKAGLDVCVCNAGYARTDAPVNANDLCTVCAAGKFEHDNVCIDCGMHGISTAASVSFDACICDVNTKRLWEYFDDISQIPPCVEAIDEVNTLQCTACAPGTYSNTIARDSMCIDCAMGEYQYEAAKSSCDACAAHKNTLAVASTYAGACVCNAGYSLQVCDDLLTSCGSSCGMCPHTRECEDGFDLSRDGTVCEKIHTFTADGSITFSTETTIDILIVAGGGGGGASGGSGAGGGGAGGLLYLQNQVIAPDSYLITVGAGGSGQSEASGDGDNGQPSTAFENRAVGGGGGGGVPGNYGPSETPNDGGSGGGGGVHSAGTWGATVPFGSGSQGQGYDGAPGSSNAPTAGGGGGSAAAATSKDGGAGTTIDISGTPKAYAGGGGGGTYYSASTHQSSGKAGGGNGGYRSSKNGKNAAANTGSGGGGAGSNGSRGKGGNGGSGIVIIREIKPRLLEKYDIEKKTFIGEVKLNFTDTQFLAGTNYLQVSQDDISYTACTLGPISANEASFFCGSDYWQYLQLTTAALALSIKAQFVSVVGTHAGHCQNLYSACSTSCNQNCPVSQVTSNDDKYLLDVSTQAVGYLNQDVMYNSHTLLLDLQEEAIIDQIDVSIAAVSNTDLSVLRIYASTTSDLQYADLMQIQDIELCSLISAVIVDTGIQEGNFNCRQRAGSFIWLFLTNYNDAADQSDQSMKIQTLDVFGRIVPLKHAWFPCTACVEGKSKGEQSNALCTDCELGSFANAPAMSQCTLCSETVVGVGGKQFYGADTTANMASTNAEDCVCAAGFGAHGGSTSTADLNEYSGVHCLACKEGFYKNIAGNNPCTQCTQEKYGSPEVPAPGALHTSESHCVSCPTLSSIDLDKNSAFFWQDTNLLDSKDDCLCVAGTTLEENSVGVDITLEQEGKCEQCAPYYYKLAQSNNAGDADDCVTCAAGYFRNSGPQFACVMCELESAADASAKHQLHVWNNPDRATDDTFEGNIATVTWARTQEDCQCNLGFYKSVDDKCNACVDGKYKDTYQSDECVECAAGKYSWLNQHEICTDCGPNSNTVQLQQNKPDANLHAGDFSCICNSGYYFSASDPLNQGCFQCLPGFFRAVISIVSNLEELQRHDCYDAISQQIRREECAACSECASGKYQTLSGKSACDSCPSFARSSQSPRTHLEACYCDEGRGGLTIDWDDVFYDAAGGGNILLDITSTSMNFDDFNCEQCAVGYFSVLDTFLLDSITYQQRLCMQCPPSTTTLSVESQVVTDCQCDVGYEPNAASDSVLHCTQCPEGKFKEIVGNHNCVDCVLPAEHGTSDPLLGASTREACACKASIGFVARI